MNKLAYETGVRQAMAAFGLVDTRFSKNASSEQEQGMNKVAYEMGVRQAMVDFGLTKQAYNESFMDMGIGQGIPERSAQEVAAYRNAQEIRNLARQRDALMAAEGSSTLGTGAVPGKGEFAAREALRSAEGGSTKAPGAMAQRLRALLRSNPALAAAGGVLGAGAGLMSDEDPVRAALLAGGLGAGGAAGGVLAGKALSPALARAAVLRNPAGLASRGLHGAARHARLGGGALGALLGAGSGLGLNALLG